MVNVIIDKNLSQNDLNTLECWVKNKQMTLQRDKCKMLFGSLKKINGDNGRKKKFTGSSSGREKTFRFYLTKSSI